ncbi:MAG: hypothetical protein JWO31_1589 [Phycisphaerales bacterium]|nr:hypothetical protein [Phycisphaerales bacterium]
MGGGGRGRGGGVVAWLLELAEAARLFPAAIELPAGVIVGSAVIDRVTRRADGVYQWHLAGVERAATPCRPSGHPQQVWFNPF